MLVIQTLVCFFLMSKISLVLILISETTMRK